MAITLIATPGAADANSFLDVPFANAYFETRAPLSVPWVTTGDEPAKFLIMATRLISRLGMGHRRLVREKGRDDYYVVGRKWTGQVASAEQALPWPRIGMTDSLGREIPENVIPLELKEATAELAGQLRIADRTLDNDVAVQGITSVRAGSVSVSFREGIEAKPIPDLVWTLIPPQWLTDEITEGIVEFMFEVN